MFGSEREYKQLDELRSYFGEKAAFYFAFLAHYTKWLGDIAIPSALALVLQLIPASWATEPGQQIGWTGFDNVLVPWFSLGIALWATFFLESWKRQESILAFIWDCRFYEQKREQKLRPEFCRNPDTQLQYGFYTKNGNFVSGGRRASPYFPRRARLVRMAQSFSLVIVCLLCLVIATLSTFVFRAFLRVSDSYATFLRNFHGESAGSISDDLAVDSTSSFIQATFNLLFIVIFNSVYRKLALKLTQWENHRTSKSFEDAFIIKAFAFTAVNSYISLFYVAFVRSSRPQLFGITTFEGRELIDACTNRTYSDGSGLENDCMFDLFVQLVIVMLGKQTGRNFMNIGLPYLVRWFRNRSFRLKRLERIKLGKQMAEASGGDASAAAAEALVVAPRLDDGDRLDELEGFEKIELESNLLPAQSLLYEYNEMAIQYGYVVMFAAAAPWTSFFCVLSNMIERRTDGTKMLYGKQRMRYEGAAGIGTWYAVFESLSLAGIIVNAFIIVFTSQVFFLSLDPFLPYVRAHSSHISPFKFFYSRSACVMS